MQGCKTTGDSLGGTKQAFNVAMEQQSFCCLAQTARKQLHSRLQEYKCIRDCKNTSVLETARTQVY